MVVQITYWEDYIFPRDHANQKLRRCWSQDDETKSRRKHRFLHTTTCRYVAVELTLIYQRRSIPRGLTEIGQRTQAIRNVLLLLFQRQLVEFTTQSELTVHKLLLDIEILNIEEALLADALDENIHKLAFALRSVELGKIDCYKISPIEVFLSYLDQLKTRDEVEHEVPLSRRHIGRNQDEVLGPASSEIALLDCLSVATTRKYQRSSSLAISSLRHIYVIHRLTSKLLG